MNQDKESKNQQTPDNLELLQKLKQKVYKGHNSALALALGRPTDEIDAWFAGSEEIDEDAEMKIIKLADERL